MQDFIKNCALFFLAVIVGLLVVEGLSRIIYPVDYGDKNFALDGHTPVHIWNGSLALKSNITYRQKTQEFNKLTSHTAQGFRGPDAPYNPDIILIGDSMTYGVGLADEETIPHLYCQAVKKECVNLGRPGASTIMAIDFLEMHLEQNSWTPTHVILMMTVMTGAMFGGNDLLDNLRDVKPIHPSSGQVKPPVKSQGQSSTGFTFRLFTHRQVLLERSNLVRLAFYVFAPVLRAALAPDFAEDELQRALNVTQQQFKRLDSLARRKGFTYDIYILHPMQDLMRKTWQNTLTDIQDRSEVVQVFSTAPALLDVKNPASYYYPLDGHLNPEGARYIARYMAGLRQGALQ